MKSSKTKKKKWLNVNMDAFIVSLNYEFKNFGFSRNLLDII